MPKKKGYVTSKHHQAELMKLRNKLAAREVIITKEQSALLAIVKELEPNFFTTEAIQDLETLAPALARQLKKELDQKEVIITRKSVRIGKLYGQKVDLEQTILYLAQKLQQAEGGE